MIILYLMLVYLTCIKVSAFKKWDIQDKNSNFDVCNNRMLIVRVEMTGKCLTAMALPSISHRNIAFKWQTVIPVKTSLHRCITILQVFFTDTE